MVKDRDSTVGINRQILSLSIPNILSNISVPLIGSVDTALMGHLSASHLAALGVVSMVFMFLYSNFGFLRMGTTGLVAQAFGSGNGREIKSTLLRASLLSQAIALSLLLSGSYIFDISVYLMNMEDSYISLGREYFSIRLLTAPAVMGLYVATGFFFGMQNARYPLYVTIVVNMVNIALSSLFVIGLDMGISGVAWGTVAAQYTGLAVSIFLMGRYLVSLPSVRIRTIFPKKEILHFLHINRNIFIRTGALTFSLAFFYSQAATHGEATLSAMVLLMQFLIWMSFAEDGFANAAESVTGRYYGAKDWKSFDISVKLSLVWGGVMALFFSILYLTSADTITALYTDDPSVASAISDLLPMTAILPPISFFAFIYDGIFIGMTAVKAMRNSLLIATAGYLASYYILRETMEFEMALWISFMLFFLFRGAIQHYLFRRYGKSLK